MFVFYALLKLGLVNDGLSEMTKCISKEGAMDSQVAAKLSSPLASDLQAGINLIVENIQLSELCS